MTDYLIPFTKLPWESPAAGLRQKTAPCGGHRLRLVEFTDLFQESDWCRKLHIGYVLEGELILDFDGRMERFHPGDGFFLPGGEDHRHKAIVPSGGRALVLLVDEG